MPSTPTQAASLAAAQAAMAALTAAANAAWIADSTAIIEDLTSQGKYQVILNHTQHVSFKDIAAYYQGLGYYVAVPRCSYWEAGYAVDQYWIQYYEYRQICGCGNCKILISWSQFPPSPWVPYY